MSLVAQLQRRPFPFPPTHPTLAPPASTASAPQDSALAECRSARNGGGELRHGRRRILAGGKQVGLPAPLSDWLPPTTPIDTGVEGNALVHLESTPSGAEVRIDGIRRGQRPAVLGLSPGSHALTLRHPNAISAVRSIDVPAEGTDLTVSLWRRQPDILPLRPVYPGASLVDARFVADGTRSAFVKPARWEQRSPAAICTRAMAARSSHWQGGSPHTHRSGGRSCSPGRTRSRQPTCGLPCPGFRGGLGQPLARHR